MPESGKDIRNFFRTGKSGSKKSFVECGTVEHGRQQVLPLSVAPPCRHLDMDYGDISKNLRQLKKFKNSIKLFGKFTSKSNAIFPRRSLLLEI